MFALLRRGGSATAKAAAVRTRAVPATSTAAAAAAAAAGMPQTSGARGVASTTAGMPQHEMVVSELHGRVALVRLNRPKKLNALCEQLVTELGQTYAALDANADVGALVLTGSDRAFAAGADIAEMSSLSYVQAGSLFADFKTLRDIKKPVVAAVRGFALGGGCELAMMCDIIVAGRSARFGQPEILLGTIPGIGGTQRLTKAVGKSKAMEMVLAGDPIDADDALRSGLVSRVVDDDACEPAALELAAKIASHSAPVVALAKAAVNAAFETTLTSGLDYERRLFESTFAFADQKEGMGAFVAKRKAKWTHE